MAGIRYSPEAGALTILRDPHRLDSSPPRRQETPAVAHTGPVTPCHATSDYRRVD
ncbi:hypothetical protein [Streptomyces collinus]|uniref:hypothetical protein n=1 Tax=Streptomyces collinus TaxID=42684 RepID=UPI00368FF707